jgi:hypothetical protein
MSARLIAFLPNRPAVARLVTTDRATRIGRAPGQDLCLDHPSVSREHALIEPAGDAWLLRDLDSKNGTFLDGKRVREATITDTAWLRFGDVMCELSVISAEEASHYSQRLEQRRATSVIFARRLEQQTALPDLLHDTLRSVCELADCERGFLLLVREKGLQVAASHAIDPRQLAGREFSGSIGAVDRSIHSRSPVVSNEAGADPQLGQRASVIAGGLRTLVCLPLIDGEEVLGAVYADSRRPGAAITELDLDLLQAFTGRAALWIAAHRDSDSLARLREQVRWDDIRAAHAVPGT